MPATSSQRTSHACPRLTLASSEGLAVERCRCGTVHLHTAAGLTLRFGEAAFLQLVETLTSAADRLEATRAILSRTGVAAEA